MRYSDWINNYHSQNVKYTLGQYFVKCFYIEHIDVTKEMWINLYNEKDESHTEVLIRNISRYCGFDWEHLEYTYDNLEYELGIDE